MAERKLPFGLGRFFGGRPRSETPTTPQLPTAKKVEFNPEESLVSFYAVYDESEERIREQLAQQFPLDPEKIGRIMEGINQAREKRRRS